MPSKTMRNIVTQIKKLRETMETVLSEQQLEVCKEKIFCFYISLYPGSTSLYRSKNKDVGRKTLKFQFQFFSTKDSIKIFVRQGRKYQSVTKIIFISIFLTFYYLLDQFHQEKQKFLIFFLPFNIWQILFRDVRRKFKDCYAAKLAEFGVSNDGGPQHG